MAFDGICISAITKECNEKILNSRIYKIAQPEKDELILTLKASSGTYRLFLYTGDGAGGVSGRDPADPAHVLRTEDQRTEAVRSGQKGQRGGAQAPPHHHP